MPETLKKYKFFIWASHKINVEITTWRIPEHEQRKLLQELGKEGGRLTRLYGLPVREPRDPYPPSEERLRREWGMRMSPSFHSAFQAWDRETASPAREVQEPAPFRESTYVGTIAGSARRRSPLVDHIHMDESSAIPEQGHYAARPTYEPVLSAIPMEEAPMDITSLEETMRRVAERRVVEFNAVPFEPAEEGEPEIITQLNQRIAEDLAAPDPEAG